MSTIHNPTPITLIPGGTRDFVNESKAKELVSTWRATLEAHRQVLQTEVPHETLEHIPTCDLKDQCDLKDDYGPLLCDTLILSDKSYTSEAASVIASFLTSDQLFQPPLAQQIKTLNMSDVIAGRMETEGLKVLQTFSDVFTDKCGSYGLVSLDISDNAMGSKGIDACRNMLVTHAGSLEELSLCNNGLSEITMMEVADILTTSSEHIEPIASRLTKLHFYNNMSGDGGCRAFQRIACNFTDRLYDLRFSSTRAGTEGSIHIVNALNDQASKGNLRNLQRLDLADNSFSMATKLSAMVERCGALQRLTLKDCLLEDEGVGQICRALETSNSQMTHLDLSANEIHGRGAAAIARLLRYTKITNSLRVLRLDENEMTSVGIQSITDAFLYCSISTQLSGRLALEELGLACNECGTDGGRALIEIKQVLPNLTSIELNDNMFSQDVLDALHETFGDTLGEIDGNDEDEDVDNDLSEFKKEDGTDCEWLDDIAATLDAITI